MERRLIGSKNDEFITKQSFSEGKKSNEKSSENQFQEPVDFDPYEPIAFSGDSYSIHEEEKKMIDEMREWAMKYFKDFQVFDSETQLPNRQVSKDNQQEFYYRDFDIQAKVINYDVIENSDPLQAKIMIQDLSGMKFESKLEVQKFQSLKRKG